MPSSVLHNADPASKTVWQARVADLLSSRPEASQIPYTVWRDSRISFAGFRLALGSTILVPHEQTDCPRDCKVAEKVKDG